MCYLTEECLHFQIECKRRQTFNTIWILIPVIFINGHSLSVVTRVFPSPNSLWCLNPAEPMVALNKVFTVPFFFQTFHSLSNNFLYKTDKINDNISIKNFSCKAQNPIFLLIKDRKDKRQILSKQTIKSPVIDGSYFLLLL